ncbi:MAG: 4-hydroxythreonine-4-phosphate dehydrogenase PdxA [Prevotella sp.]|nr:4-hydroxythreonine-4-phosphate dehydrogenase PdxA [Prevotella sp.]MCM1075668.1 4-hydroxythreonine-4-phosphate dehydrogenase PdxA [Ruminococcus sp.]
MSNQRNIRVGITHGDINGIGYEVIMKALANEMITELCTPVIFGHQRAMMQYRKQCGIDPAFRFTPVATTEDIKDGEINFIEIAKDQEITLTPGKPSAEGGALALAALEEAVKALRSRRIDVLVTAPINKEAMKMAGFPFPGHTEYLADRLGDGTEPVMILMSDNPQLRVALQSTHLPIVDVAKSVTTEAIADKLHSLNSTMRKDFAIERPKIAVLSLNPHAGDGGAIGNEEVDVISPAIEQTAKRKIQAFGPYASDGFFGSGKQELFDVILAMYHDQGLIPFKMLAMEHGVNFTAGLPYVRTSPDHGTGYDIVGKGEADPTSMREAIYAAIDIYRRRWDYIRSRSNPLKKQYVDKSGDKEVLDLTKEDNTPDEILL